METLLDLLGSFVDWGPTGLISRRWIRKYQAGDRVFLKGTATGVSVAARWSSYLVAEGGWLYVASDRSHDTELCPLPAPAYGSTVEVCPGTLRGKMYHYRYHSDSGDIEVYPPGFAGGDLVKRVLDDMHDQRSG